MRLAWIVVGAVVVILAAFHVFRQFMAAKAMKSLLDLVEGIAGRNFHRPPHL